MELGLQGKNVLVTAASEGIGFSIAKQMVAEGAHVFLSSRSESKLEIAKEKISSDRVIGIVVADMCCANDINSLVDYVLSKVSQIDVLVHNNGGPVAGKLFKLSEQEWQQAYAMIIDNYRLLVMGVLPKMLSNRWGRIISIGSTSIRQPIADLLLSNTFRPALAGLNKSLSDIYGKEGVTFNTLCPGGILTGRIERILAYRAKQLGTDVQHQKDDYISNIPMGRFGSARDVADAATFLASDCANFITGTCLAVDGGISRSIA